MLKSRRIIQYTLIAFAALSVVALGTVFIQFKNEQAQPVQLPKSATKALMRLAKIHQTATREGKVEWELDAESAQLETQSGRMILKMPTIEFYMQDGQKAHLTAELGVLDTHSNDMQVNGNVRLKNDRYTLLTEALVYDHDDRTLTSEKPIFIKSNAFDLRADKMTYNLDSNLAQFDGQVEGTLSENATF